MRRKIIGILALATIALMLAPAAWAGSVLRVAMTLADIPLTTGQSSQGGEGQRFIGVTLYDALVNWDLSKRDEVAKLVPGLAESWSVDEASNTVWTFKLRPNVKFHDGSNFNADAVLFNFDKVKTKDAPQFDPAQAAQASTFVAPIKSWRKIDDLTVELTTDKPNAVVPYLMASFAMSSPARWEEMGRSWAKVADKPSGTGPWILERLVPRERAELVRNPNYWDPARVPKSDRLILLAMPDASSRVAALLSGSVDWIEAPAPDSVPKLKSAGMQIVTNVYPHIWPYQLSYFGDSPMKDIRVRKALNLAIDRDGLVKLLGGLAMPAKGQVASSSPWFGKPNFDITYDPEQAKKLLTEAGYGPKHPLKVKFLISTAGSGQMQPLPMNEFIQENLRDIGVEVTLDAMEWEALRARRRAGADAPENAGAHGLNNSWGYVEPINGLIGIASSKFRPPVGYNWGAFSDPVADGLADDALRAFVPKEQDEILARLHAYIVDQAMWIWVVHDLNPRAMSPKVRGFVQAQAWVQDLTPVYVGE
jgi:peptide/nickel transport system substrate-binding protein